MASVTAAEKSLSQIVFPLCCLRVPREIKPIVCVCVRSRGWGWWGRLTIATLSKK